MWKEVVVMGLSSSDVAGLAETLSAGKHPKVVFTDAAGQIAGKTGKVVRLEEPTDGDFVVVQFGHDELPFSTTELRVPERGEFSRKTAKQKSAEPPQPPGPVGAPLLDEGDNERAVSVPTVKESSAVSEQEAVMPRQSEGSDPAAPVPAPRKKAAKVKQAPELSVTLSWKDNEWSVTASKGTKVIAKPVPVKAATAVHMVQSLDSPAVAAVVEDIVEQQRQQAADEAERLRQELAAVEAKLAELN
jgi:hypothetical protein